MNSPYQIINYEIQYIDTFYFYLFLRTDFGIMTLSIQFKAQIYEDKNNRKDDDNGHIMSTKF